jgi:hypothetical protein
MFKSIMNLLLMSDAEVLGLNEQAALGVPRQPERSQFSHLLRHFLERFFNHETTSPDGDAKARMVLIACTAGLPPFVVAIYLWPLYHAFIRVLQPFGMEAIVPGRPPYWVQVNHHFFFVVYSFAALGIATVFQWDLFFPDLLDLLVLNTLPIPYLRLFFARITAIAILIAGFLFDANVLAIAFLPEAIDPPSVPRFLAGHALAAVASGLFAAAFILALQGVLLFIFGERWFRKISLLVQGATLAAMLLTLLLFPVYSGATAAVLRSGGHVAYWVSAFLVPRYPSVAYGGTIRSSNLCAACAVGRRGYAWHNRGGVSCLSSCVPAQSISIGGRRKPPLQTHLNGAAAA